MYYYLLFYMVSYINIKDKEKQKINHLKKSWPIMMDLFFINAPNAMSPKGAKRFGDRMLERVEKWHDIMVEKWEECGKDRGFKFN